MRRLALLAVLAVLSTASLASASEPPPDCALHSIEGIRLGMTLDQARTATPSWNWHEPTKLVPHWWALNGGPAKATGQLRLLLSGDRVVGVEREYLPSADISIPGVQQAFRERFGARGQERSGPGTSQFQAVTSRVSWTDDACDAMAWVDDGRRFEIAAGRVIEFRVLITGVMDVRAARETMQAEAAKVKF